MRVCIGREMRGIVGPARLDHADVMRFQRPCARKTPRDTRAEACPDRVSALILIGGYAAGWWIGAAPEERERREAMMTLTRLRWGTNNSAYRHIFSQTFMPDGMPDGMPDELAWFDELQRQTTSPDNAVRFQDAFEDIDVRDRLALVRAPTLMLHARHNERINPRAGPRARDRHP